MKVITSTKKIKSPKRSPKKSPIKSLDKYRAFLGDKNDAPVSKDKKVIHVKRKIVSPKGSSVTKSSKTDIKDINDIEQKMLQMKESQIKMPTQNTTSDPQVKPIQKPIQKPVQKPIQKPKVSRSNRRSTSRKSNRKNKGRKVSIKTRVFNEKDVKEVESRIKEIRGKKTGEIREELEKQGVKVSGKSNRLLRDIYLYSKVCNINIQHEK